MALEKHRKVSKNNCAKNTSFEVSELDLFSVVSNYSNLHVSCD